MKRNILIAATLTMLAVQTFGQGMVIFQAAAGKLQYTTDGTTLISAPIGNPDSIPGGYGPYNVAIYSASAGTVLNGIGGLPDLSGPWHIQTSPILRDIDPLAGAMSGVNVTLDVAAGAPGAVEQIEIVAWTGNFNNFQAALAGGGLLGWSGDSLSGGLFNFQMTTGTALSPAAISLVPGAFNKLVVSAPEPSTLALGGLGAAALFFFRRRRK